MNELSERARELATKYMGANCMEHCWCQYSEKNADDYVSCEDKLVGLIEQALLAERRLALETMAVWFLTAGHDQQAEWYSDEVAKELRAAAEKEVSNG